MSRRRFAFLHDPRFSGPLRALGVTPRTCWVDVGEGVVEARYGPWRVRTPVANVVDVTVSGPYRWYRAVGPRLSLADRGATFGTSAHAGACLRFAEPVPGLFGPALRHPGLTVTVADPEGLARALGE